jgi:hypothetical protein
MNGDEMSRGMYQQNRRPSSQNRSYNSPSANYSYNYNSNGNGNSGYNNGGGHQQSYKKPGAGGHTNNKFKSHHGGGGGSSDKMLVKQNDQIIKLLKEIRDRLPAPPAGTPVAQPAPEQEDDDVVDRGNYIEYAERGNERDTSEDDAADEPDFVALDEPDGESEES